MAKNVSLFIITIVFSVNSLAKAPDQVSALVQRLRSPTVTCPEKIWSDYNWKSFKFVAVYPSKSDSWVWDVAGDTIASVPNSQLPPSALGSSYEFFELAGKSSASLNMEEPGSEQLELITHEFFHYQGQKNWKREGAGSRGTAYPLEWKPRFYRRMINDRLKDVLQSGKLSDLQAASFWFQKWAKEYPNEVLSTTDGYEGTANYVELMSTAIAELGCSASDSDLRAKAIKIVNSSHSYILDPAQLSLDGEGYSIGSLAALLLRFNLKNLSAWNQSVKEGKTPLEILLKSVEPSTQVADKSIARSYYSSAKTKNVEYSKVLDIPIQNWSDKAFVRVAVPYSWMLSNLMPKFFAVPTALKMDVYPLAVDHQYKSKSGSGEMTIKENSVLFEDMSGMCGPGQYISIPKNTVVEAVGKVSFNNSIATGTIVGAWKKDSAGFDYFCVNEE